MPPVTTLPWYSSMLCFLLVQQSPKPDNCPHLKTHRGLTYKATKSSTPTKQYSAKQKLGERIALKSWKLRAPRELFRFRLPSVLSHHQIPVPHKGSKTAIATGPAVDLGFGVWNIAASGSFEVFLAAKHCFSVNYWIGQENKLCFMLNRLCCQQHPRERGIPTE